MAKFHQKTVGEVNEEDEGIALGIVCSFILKSPLYN